MKISNDLKETILNIVIGTIVSTYITTQIFIVPVAFAMGATAVYTVSSFLRMYALRKIFRRIECRNQK